MHEQGVGAGEREIPVKDRTLGRTQGGAYVERSTEEYQGRLVESDPIYCGRGSLQDSGCAQESMEFAARGVKRILRCLRGTPVQQRPFTVGDGFAQHVLDRTFSELWRVVQVADDFAAQCPQIVTVPVACAARQILAQQVQQEWLEYFHDPLAGNQVAFFYAPTMGPIGQVRAVGVQVRLG
jgi:hypothetical protein